MNIPFMHTPMVCSRRKYFWKYKPVIYTQCILQYLFFKERDRHNLRERERGCLGQRPTFIYFSFVYISNLITNKQTNEEKKKRKERKEPHVYYYYIKKYHLGNKQKKNYKFGLARFYSIHPSIQPTNQPYGI